MHKALCGAVAAIALIGTPAFAADTPVKAPPPPPAPVYSWTGWYVGGNIGASYGTFKTDFNAPLTVAVTDTTPRVLELPVAFPLSAFLTPIQRTRAASSVVVRSATIGSSHRFGSRALRPTSKAISKDTAIQLPVTSMGTSRVVFQMGTNSQPMRSDLQS